MARVQRASLLNFEQDAEITRRYAAGETAQQIADRLGTYRSKILRELHFLGVEVRDNRQAQTRHTVRHDAFDVLTPDAAYWCGFLFADGSVSRRPGETPEVSVGLSECDRDHLVKLRDFLGSTHAITAVPARMNTFATRTYMSRASCRFTVRSFELADRLCALGRYEGPVDVGLTQSRDFWRGVIDGDGSLGFSVGYTFLKVVGSQRLLEEYVRFLGRVGTRRLHVRPHRSIYCVSTSGATAERVISRLYGNASTALDRKAAKAADTALDSVETPAPPAAG